MFITLAIQIDNITSRVSSITSIAIKNLWKLSLCVTSKYTNVDDKTANIKVCMLKTKYSSPYSGVSLKNSSVDYPMAFIELISSIRAVTFKITGTVIAISKNIAHPLIPYNSDFLAILLFR